VPPANFTDPTGLFADALLNFANDGQNIYGVIPTDSWVGGFYQSTGNALGSTNPEFFANANAWTLLGGTAAFSTAVVLSGGTVGYAAGAFGLTGGAAFIAGGVGASAGMYGGMMQTYAADPNAGFGQYALGGGLGAVFGAWMPGAGVGTLAGTLGGAGVGSYYGNASLGAQVGGLVGGIAGGGLHGGWRPMAWEVGGAGIGAAGGYAWTGNAQGALYGANLGMFGAGITRGIAGGVAGLYRGARAPGTGAGVVDDAIVAPRTRVSAPSQTGAQTSAQVRNPTIQNPGKISGNLRNMLVETGIPLKNRFGWRKRWYRMTVDDYNAYQRSVFERHLELLEETKNWHKVGREARSYHLEEMGEFRNNWLKDFLKDRKY